MNLPRLLTEGAGSIEWQVLGARCRREEFSNDDLFICQVDPVTVRNVIPLFLSQKRDGTPRSHIGCIEVTSRRTPMRAFKEGDWSDYTAHIFFTMPAYRLAWSAARKLRQANPHQPALFRDWELAGCFIQTTDRLPALIWL